MPDTTLVLVRHPRTQKSDKKQDLNTGLDKRGVKEAYSVAKKLATVKVETAIYASQYRRSQVPAFIFRTGLGIDEISIDPIFNEIQRPMVDGRPFSTLDDYFQWRQNIIKRPNEQNIRSRFKNTGESFWQLYERAGLIHQIFHLPQFRGKRNVAFTHSHLIAMIRSYDILGPNPTAVNLMETFNEMFPDYCSITTIKIY